MWLEVEGGGGTVMSAMRESLTPSPLAFIPSLLLIRAPWRRRYSGGPWSRFERLCDHSTRERGQGRTVKQPLVMPAQVRLDPGPSDPFEASVTSVSVFSDWPHGAILRRRRSRPIYDSFLEFLNKCSPTPSSQNLDCDVNVFISSFPLRVPGTQICCLPLTDCS